MNTTLQETFYKYASHGLSVIPVRVKTKRPILATWKPFQSRIATADEISEWQLNGVHGVAVVCGAVSGNLLMFDFDNHLGNAEETFYAWVNAAEEMFPNLIQEHFFLEQSQSGGFHAVCRTLSLPKGNQKLAQMLLDGKPTEIIETRGEGGYFVCAPTAGYETMSGSLLHLEPIGDDVLEALYILAAEFSTIEPEEYHPAHAPSQAQPSTNGDKRPGDDFNERGEEVMKEALIGAGWKRVGVRGVVEYWRRPGKTDGISASYNFGGSGKLISFSSNAYPLDSSGAPRAYSKFSVYALLVHNGDFHKAAQDLYRLGYGDRIEAKLPPRRRLNSESTPQPASTNEDFSPLSVPIADVPTDSDFKLDELGNGERLEYCFGDYMRFDHSSGRWLIWNGRYWQFDEREAVMVFAKRVIDEFCWSEYKVAEDSKKEAIAKHIARSRKLSQLRAMLDYARSLPTISLTHEYLDRDPLKFTVQNGCVNLATGEFEEHKPTDHITKISDAVYDAGAECPRWIAFLKRIFSDDEELCAFVQRAVGYSLSGSISEQCMFFAYGKGKNGKSVFFEALKMLLGTYWQKTPSETLMVKRNENGMTNDIARLRGARFVVAAEVAENGRLNESRVKDLTGGDTLTARFLHREFFDFLPVHKLWMFGNHKPNIVGTDEGIWRRIQMIPFLVTIPESERKPMEQLLGEFRDEMSGILNWAIEGWLDYSALRAEGKGLNPPSIVTESVGNYRTEMDSLGVFVEENITPKQGAKVRQKDLYARYKTWAEANGEYVMKNRELLRRLQERGFTMKRGSGNLNEWQDVELASIVSDDDKPF